MSKKYPQLPYTKQPEFTKVVEVLKDSSGKVLIYAFEYNNEKEGFVLYFTNNYENIKDHHILKITANRPFTDVEFNWNMLQYLKFYLDHEGV
jgi:hypothetical protein